jgi:hypothetical protein
MKKTILVVLFGALLTLGASPSHAAAPSGIAVRPDTIAVPARVSLQADIQAYRVASPGAFAALRKVRGHRPEVYRELRNPLPLLGATQELRALGSAALLPMLHELAFESRPRDGASEVEWAALREALIDTVGLLRDRRAAPVLLAAFEQGSLEPGARAAAARGLGRLGGDAELAALRKHTAAGDPARPAAITGLGECKRIESAQTLVSLLTQEKDEAEAERVARAMGAVSSSWAWQAMGADRQADGLAVRLEVARSLVPAFARLQGEAQDRVRKSLLMAEHPDTLALIDAEIGKADQATATALRSLRQSIARALARR